MLRPPREYFDHTGDVGVRITAPNLAELFRQATMAFAEILTDPRTVNAATSEAVAIEAATLEDLLVEWLNELLYRFEVRNLLPADAELTVSETDAGWMLNARVQSESFVPNQHPIKVLIKGVTYHQLEVVRNIHGWETAVVFDI